MYCSMLVEPSTLQFSNNKPVVKLIGIHYSTVLDAPSTKMYNNLTLSASDCEIITSKRWFNDVIIDCYMCLLSSYGPHRLLTYMCVLGSVPFFMLKTQTSQKLHLSVLNIADSFGLMCKVIQAMTLLSFQVPCSMHILLW